MRLPIAVFAAAALGTWACDGSPAAPAPTPSVRVVSFAPSLPGAEVVVPLSYPYILPGGVVLPRPDSLVHLDVDVRSGHELVFARLNVFLLTGGTTDEYCGLNDPDTPTWTDLPAGWSDRVTIGAFRVHRLPCEVTGFRVVLHNRDDGRLTPPTSNYVIAETVVPARFLLRREE